MILADLIAIIIWVLLSSEFLSFDCLQSGVVFLDLLCSNFRVVCWMIYCSGFHFECSKFSGLIWLYIVLEISGFVGECFGNLGLVMCNLLLVSFQIWKSSFFIWV